MLALMDGLRRDIAEIRHPSRSVIDDAADQRLRALAERLAEGRTLDRADQPRSMTTGLSLVNDERRRRR